VIGQGVALTIIGMVVVFAFLLMMIILMQLLAVILRKLFPEKPEPAVLPARKEDPEIAAAIAAVARFFPGSVGKAASGSQGEIAAAVAAVKTLPHTSKG
jgi:sodium pump decarboxylase gamma subunit